MDKPRLMRCPECGSTLQPMEEMSRFMCMKCQIVWHIANVIALAVAGLLPMNKPLCEVGPTEGVLE